MSGEMATQAFVRSYREAPKAALRVGEVDPAAMVRLTVVLRPEAAIHPASYAGRSLSRMEFREQHGTSRSVLDRVARYAEAFGLQVAARDEARHRVNLVGTYGQARAAFKPDELGIYEAAGHRFVARGGHLHVPIDLAAQIVAIQGFDQRPVARPQFRLVPRAAALTSYDPAQLADLYHFPAAVDGSGQTVALLELAGGYDASEVAQYFADKSISRTGQLASVPVDGAGNAVGDPSGADGEVQLDIDVVGSVAPGANIAVYFSTNTASGFLDAVQAALHDATHNPSVISISWGGPESAWAGQDMDAMDQAFQSAAALGVTVCAAAGDRGAVDGSPDGQKTTDFPASSPNVLACGGTSLPQPGAETAWNDGNGAAGGGGFSAHFPQPLYQRGIAATGRGVPDVSADADPLTGYNVRVDGQQTVAGGTSAVAPLWAGLVARINQSLGRRAGFINPALYAMPGALADITTGGNDGFAAGPGWDPVTGLGSPNGAAVLEAIRAQAASAVA